MFDPTYFNDIYDLIDRKLLRWLAKCTFSSGTEASPTVHFLSDNYSWPIIYRSPKNWCSPMTEERARRKLSGILSADAVGYSRMMQKDEASTIRSLENSKELMTNLIQKYCGRVVDAPGDNLLAEFGSVVNAVECAVEIQNELKRENEELTESRKMRFRIGINLGDVIEKRGRIYGDGVNIAARIEGMAEARGICISRSVYDQVKNKLALGYEYLGEHEVKNISEPIPVYRILVEPDIPVIETIKRYKLPDKPSIAVIPFVNISGDPEQEYFSDGITEEIITALSNIPKMFVIARNSTFTYKNKPANVQLVSEQLGVQYVLNGSVRKAGDRVRITAQLVDSITGLHKWAERYDRGLNDIFALQDEITLKILTALQVKLTEGEQARVWAKRTKNLEAFLMYLQARQLLYHISKDDNALARQMAQEAIELDQKYSDPYVVIAWSHIFDARQGWSESRTESFKLASQMVRKAQALDKSNPEIYILLGYIQLHESRHEQAIAAGQKAITLGPNNADIHADMALILRFAGRFEEAIIMIQRALRLQPSYPSWWLGELAMCYYYVYRHEEAIGLAEQFHSLVESRGEDSLIYWYHTMLAMNYIRLGRNQEAHKAAAEALRLFPGYSLDWDRKLSPYKNPEHLERQHEDLRKAGVR
jgi:adenylate cyclase